LYWNKSHFFWVPISSMWLVQNPEFHVLGAVRPL
jgi:hypothetical protein